MTYSVINPTMWKESRGINRTRFSTLSQWLILSAHFDLMELSQWNLNGYWGNRRPIRQVKMQTIAPVVNGASCKFFFFLKTANLLRDYQALPHDASTTKSQSARGRGGNAADAPTNFIMCNFNTLKAAVVNSTARVQCSRCPNFKQELIGNWK